MVACLTDAPARQDVPRLWKNASAGCTGKLNIPIIHVMLANSI